MKKEIITIEWIDSNIYDNQSSLDGEYPTAKVITVGYLVKETEDRFIVTREIFVNEKDARGTIAIPKSCITKVKRGLK